MEIAKEHFKGRPEFVALLNNNMDRKAVDLKWTVNIDTLYDKFD